MRIGLFSDTYPPYINGVSTSVNMLKIALEKLGHEVFVITVNDKLLDYSFEEDDHVIRVPGIKTGIYDYRLTSAYPLKIIKKIKSMNLDIVHVHTEFSIGSFGRIIAKQFNIPIVATYHTYYEDYLYYINKGFFDKTSKKLLKTLTQFYEDKTVDSLIVPAEKINIKFLIDAHKKLINDDKKYKLVIVGDGPDVKNLKEASKDIKDNVIFAGKSPWEDVPCYYDMADVFVTASKSETQGLTVLEALASSTPVVCANDPSYIDAILPGTNGYVFDTEEEYIKNIKKLKADENLRKDFAKNAREYSENFSALKYGERVLEVYNETIKNHKSFKDKYIEKEMIGKSK